MSHHLTDKEKKKKEEIALAIKKHPSELKKRYGDRWKNVAFATATKMAMKEDAKIKNKKFKPGELEANVTGQENLITQKNSVNC